MDRKNCARARRDGGRGLLDVDVEGVGSDIDENRRRSDTCDAPAGGEERERSGDDLVALSDSESHQGHHQGIRSARNTDSMLDADILGDLLLEGGNLRAKDVAARSNHLGRLLGQSIDQRLVLAGDIEHWDGFFTHGFSPIDSPRPSPRIGRHSGRKLHRWAESHHSGMPRLCGALGCPRRPHAQGHLSSPHCPLR